MATPLKHDRIWLVGSLALCASWILTALVVKMEGAEVAVVAGEPKDITVLAADFPPKMLLPPAE